MPAISVLIPLFNAAAYIEKTVQSVLNQSYQNFELIILDDCSTDGSYELSFEIANEDERIRVYKNEHNLGMLQNWNKGIGLCNSPYFVKLDADDLWHSTMLSKAIEILDKKPTVGLVFSKYINIDSDGNLIKNSEQDLPEFAKNKAFSCIPIVKQGPDKFLGYPILRQGLSVMRKEVFDRVGLYQFLLTKETQASTDTEFYFRVGAHFKIFCIDEDLYFYRIHPTSISALDSQNLLSAKKIFETKYCIVKYYADYNLLNLSEAKEFFQKINKEYNFAQIAALRKSKDWRKLFKVFSNQLFQFPLSTFKFYYRRIAEKVI